MHAAIFALKRAYLSTQHYVQQQLVEFDLTPAQLDILIFLCGNANCGQKHIETVFGIRSATLARLLTTMEKRELIVRTADAADSRQKNVALTPRGKLLVDEVRQAKNEALTQRFFAHFSDEETQQLEYLLKRVAKNMGDTSQNFW